MKIFFKTFFLFQFFLFNNVAFCANVFEKDTLEIFKKLVLSKEFLHKNDNESLKHSLFAYDLAKKMNSNEWMGRCENQIGNIYWYAGDYNLSSEYYFKALKHYEKTNKNREIANCLRNIAWIYLEEKKFQESEKFFEKSKQMAIQLKNEKGLMIAYDDLANLFTAKNELSKALECSKLSLEISTKLKDKLVYESNLATLGQIYFKMNNYVEAEKYILQAIENFKRSDAQSFNLSLSYLVLTEIKFLQNKYRESLEYSMESKKYAEIGSYYKEIAISCKWIAKIHAKLKQFDKAYYYENIYNRINDSLNQLKQVDYIKNQENKYDAQQRKIEIHNLEKKRLINESKLEKEKYFRYLLLILLIFVGLFTFFIVKQFNTKRKANLKLMEANALIEEKNKNISESIEYAKQIQHARLPSKQNIKKSFPNNFITYLPRDTVSGDFYWFDNNLDDIFIICADCTGHGIPGAFMSMIGIDGFNYAILEKKITEPSQILSKVNQFIKDSLNQEDILNVNRDGMDVALLKISKDRKKMIYTGANRPLWIIRDNQLLEFSPNKMSIGGNYEVNFEFLQKEINLVEKDKIYLFSDGFADQFGGKDGKKFKTKNFKKLLLSTCFLDINDQQKAIEKELQSWKSDHEQVDDILVIGIEI